ncbi:MAG TPA: hypothetical protein VIX87_12140 [Steroidobacteraceae bacterium]
MALAVMLACILECPGGRATAAAADAETVNPCKLITQAEAQSALGMPVKPGEFVETVYRICSFKPANGGTYYLNVSLFSIDKATFDRADPRQFERAAGTNLDAFVAKSSPLLNVWHAGNQLQMQIHFGDNAGQAGAKAAELKLAAIAVTRF